MECPECGDEVTRYRDGIHGFCINCGEINISEEDSTPSKNGLRGEKEHENIEEYNKRDKPSPSFMVKRINVSNMLTIIVKSILLFVLPVIVIWIGFEITDMIIFLSPAIFPMMAILSIIVGMFVGLCSRSSGAGNAFISIFLGSIIIMLVMLGDSPMDEVNGEIYARFFVISIFYGFVGVISAVIVNSVTSNLMIGTRYVCSNCEKVITNIDNTKKCPHCGTRPQKSEGKFPRVIEEIERV